jgi:DNA-binding response OmpR family regulator
MSNVVDVHIAHLRRKLRSVEGASPLVQTVRGVGYVFQKDGA